MIKVNSRGRYLHRPAFFNKFALKLWADVGIRPYEITISFKIDFCGRCHNPIAHEKSMYFYCFCGNNPTCFGATIDRPSLIEYHEIE